MLQDPSTQKNGLSLGRMRQQCRKAAAIVQSTSIFIGLSSNGNLFYLYSTLGHNSKGGAVIVAVGYRQQPLSTNQRLLLGGLFSNICIYECMFISGGKCAISLLIDLSAFDHVFEMNIFTPFCGCRTWGGIFLSVILSFEKRKKIFFF